MRPKISKRNSTDRSAVGFDRFQLRPELIQAIDDSGYTEPRPIQTAGIPPALAGEDVLGLAQTGTGKTAAFVLPILERLLSRRRPGPRALVVTPTRELASQVHAEFERLAQHTPLTAAVVFGGVPVARQIRALRRRPDIVVACPGRLLDLMGQRAIGLENVEVLVLDEADHMFDMGFLPDVRRILGALPARRQNLMFSATMPREIRKLADQVLRKPTVIELANSRPAETIAHAIYPLAEPDKVGALENLIASEGFRSAIVFVRTKRRAKRLAERLAKRRHGAVALQGNMSQGQRERALLGFREGTYDVMVATDIAARGLDIAGVSHVINFDVPNTPDAYTHRIGRTGRSEESGTAFTFVTPDDADAVRAVEKRLGEPIERRDPSELGAIKRSSLMGTKSSRRAGPAAPRGPKGQRQRRNLARANAPAKTKAKGPVRGSKPVAAAPARRARPEAAAPVERGAFGLGIGESRASGRGSSGKSGERASSPPRRRGRRS